MKLIKSVLMAAGVLTVTSSRADLIVSQSFSGGTLPAGTPSGTSFYGTFSDAGAGDQVLGISVGLNISGGYNGVLYSYLVAPNGTLVTLLDQPGFNYLGNVFGASGAGMNITLQDGTTDHGSIQNETSTEYLTGSYNPATTLGTFNNSSANGDWTLYFATKASVDGATPTDLVSWNLNITVVPEPVNIALGIFAGAMVLIQVVRWKSRAKVN